MKSDICFWKWGFDKVFWNFISEVSSHIYCLICLGNGISVDVLTDGRILYLDLISQDNFQRFRVLSYNLMLNSGKQFCALRDKKIDILTLVLSEKKILNETKNHNPPCKLNGRSLIHLTPYLPFSLIQKQSAQ
jgi:hypothetical protein